MKIPWWFIHPNAIQDVHVFLSSVENKLFLRKIFFSTQMDFNCNQIVEVQIKQGLI